MRRFPILLLICALAAFGLAACGGDDEGNGTTEATTPTETTTTEEGAGGGGGGRIEVSADPGGALEFEQKSLTAEPGRNTVEFTNPSSTPHDVVIEDEGGQEIAKTEVITDGEDTATAELQAAEYTFFCSVPGHRQAGMEGPLRVE